MVSAREIVGKRIVAFRPGTSRQGQGASQTTMHDPEIELEDGTVLVFGTEEHPDAAWYGIWIGRRLAPKVKP